MRVVRVLLLVIALGIFYYTIYRQTHPAQSAPTPAAGNGLEFNIHPISVTNNLDLGDFVVSAKGTHDVPITVDETQMRNARLLGFFSTSKGPGVQVMLLDESQYRNFQNHSTPSEYIYLSKPAANGTIDIALPRPGKYYLIFDNSTSDSNTNVKASVAIRGEMVRVEAPSAQPPAQKK
jgi:hypothetical protein